MVYKPHFGVVTGRTIRNYLKGREADIVGLIKDTYLLHDRGDTVNPRSYFLRFPEDPQNRIIALPAAVSGQYPMSGIKWISSYPRNIEYNIPRASAVLVVNDAETGFPTACLESSIISATRTSASAILAANMLSVDRSRPKKLSIIGTGLISRYVHKFFQKTGWNFDEILIYDLVKDNSYNYKKMLQERGENNVHVADTQEDAVKAADIIVYATVSGEPHACEPGWFAHNPIILHLSLRDLGVEVIQQSQNIVDDVDHVLQAGTSVLRAVEKAGGNCAEIVDGTLADVITGKIKPSKDKPIVFSPFGLGVLDLALAGDILRYASHGGKLINIPDFYDDLDRLVSE